MESVDDSESLGNKINILWGVLKKPKYATSKEFPTIQWNNNLLCEKLIYIILKYNVIND